MVSDNVYDLMGCHHAGKRLPVVVDLRKVTVCPTHYSLRNGGCAGMEGDWNFEASVDGKSWIVLHEARGDRHLIGMNISDGRESGERRWIRDVMKHTDDAQKEEIYCDYFERNHRHFWRIGGSDGDGDGEGDGNGHGDGNGAAVNAEEDRLFFRYFRLIGASPRGSPDCLHAIGLEIYGHVSES